MDFSKLTPEQLLKEATKLGVELETTTKKLADSDKELKAVKAELANTANELKATKAELDATVQTNESLSEEIEKLGSHIEKAKSKADKSGVSLETFDFGGETYEFALLKTTTMDGVITEKEVLASESLQERLVTSGSAMIRKAR